jgi:protein-S-isoprenylcysteine O-methyltransferase Ste14
MDRFRTWAEKEYSPRKRFIAIVVAGAFFLFLFPGLIIFLANGIDSIFKLPSFDQGTLNSFIGAILILSGGAFAIGTIVAQYRFARGTPLPMMATQELLIDGPFSYCRNPMSLGTIVMYFGLVAWIGSWSALVIVLSLGLILLAYLWVIEEKELEMRFGEEYRAYRAKTSFILPKLRDR